MNIVKECRKHVHIFWLFIKNCLAAQMEYRLNFVISILQEKRIYLCQAAVSYRHLSSRV